MAQIPLSEQLEANVGKRTKVKYDDAGNRVGGGTLITSKLVGEVYKDECIQLEIEENNEQQIINAIDTALAAALEEIGLRAERHAKAKTPVDTGRLRNSITHVIDMGSQSVYIGTNVEYAPYIEFGVHGKDGKKREGHHMLRDAAENHKDEYGRVVAKHVRGQVGIS